MKKSITRWAALGAATVVGAAVLAPLGGAAQAAGGVQTQFYTAVKAGDTQSRLYSRASSTPLSPAGASVRELRGSRDGSRFVTVELSLDGSGNQVYSIVVYDVSGRRITTAYTASSATYDLLFPVLSPDGSKVAWNRGEHATPGAALMVKNLVTGALSTLTNTVGATLQPVFLTDSTLLVRDADLRGYTVPVTGGEPTYLPSLPDKAIDVTVSPNGKAVAWEDEYYGSPVTAEIAVASLSTTGGITIGTPVVSQVGQDNFVPSFSRDGKSVYFVHNDGAGGPGSLRRLTVTYDGNGVPTALGSLGSLTAVGPVAYQAIGETVLAPATQGATLAGSYATVRWTKPADPRVTKVLVERFLGTTRQKGVFVSLPALSYRDSGLVIGNKYEYRFTAYTSGGSRGATAKRFLVSAAAKPTTPDPTSNGGTRAPFSVKFGVGTSAVRWVVDYRTNGGSWTRWVNAVSGTTRTFGSPATTGVNATTSALGRTYQFRSRAFDAYGNSTAAFNVANTVGVGSPTVVPLDQGAATIGGTTVASSSAWLGSYRRLTSTSQYARISLYGNRLQVIGWKCGSCGSFAIYDGSTKIATVSTWSSSVKARTVLFAKYYATNATHTFTIRPLGTAGHPAVLLDGFAMRR